MSNDLIEKEILIQKLVVEIQKLSNNLNEKDKIESLKKQLEDEQEEYNELILKHFKDRI